ncbi:MAG: hypothetical protein ABI041_09885, partial [Bdellovibrionia bacterium]
MLLKGRNRDGSMNSLNKQLSAVLTVPKARRKPRIMTYAAATGCASSPSHLDRSACFSLLRRAAAM